MHMPLDAETFRKMTRACDTYECGMNTDAGYIEADAWFDVETEREELEPYSYGGSRGYVTTASAKLVAFPMGGLILSRGDCVLAVGEEAVAALEADAAENFTGENE
jgi:hypothetical protein